MLHFQAPNRWKNVVRLAFLPDGSAILGGCLGHGVVSWDVGSGAVQSHHRLQIGGVFGLLLAPDGGFVCVPAGWGGLVQLSYPDLQLLSNRNLSEGGYGGYVRFAALSPDGARILRSRFAAGAIPYGSAVVSGPPQWDHLEWERLEQGWLPATGTFLHGGQQIVLAERSFPRTSATRLAVRDTATGAVLRAVACSTKELVEVVASSDGRWCALMAGRSLWVWDVAHWDSPPKKLPNDTRFHFTSSAFHPSGRYLAATSNDATVKLYDTTTWELGRAFTWDIGKMRSVCFSSDGTLAAAGSDSGKVVVWDVDL